MQWAAVLATGSAAITNRAMLSGAVTKTFTIAPTAPKGRKVAGAEDVAARTLSTSSTTRVAINEAHICALSASLSPLSIARWSVDG